ncbi:MbtH family NRPS accessory protein [Virgisporangium ochraceum]|uniref:Antibiotic synthesis protein MbtH n=1 Tax=Virgisporangium ochraceum TaxID=65505 RepID=A0A8J3ZQG9_9ACTN|nr:MbtH family NRPS accessory protein [Virgisporangium ochraceum]GIJ67177.1 antibiotic synthesis protein MbtH [Virgisporangium ochraceum]
MSDPSQQFQIVLNPERQHSIWPVDQPLPEGWQTTGRVGSKSECLAFIDAVWNDVNPLSQRHLGGD